MTALKNGGRRSGSPLVSESVVTDENWYRVGFAWDGTNLEPGEFWSGLIDDMLIYNRTIRP